MNKIDSLLLSKYILAIAGPMNQLKLQKLLYYTQAWHMVILESEIIEDDFEAWLHGPVSRKVWDNFKSSSVLYNHIELAEGEAPEIIEEVQRHLVAEQVELIDDVMARYADKSAYYLESLTHSEDPWKNARKGLGETDHCDSIISKDSIKSYYSRLFGEGGGQN